MKRIITTIIALVVLLSIFSADKIQANAYTKKCNASGCTENAVSGGNYCYGHTCRYTDCKNMRASGSTYCSSHTCKASGCQSSAYYTSGKWKGYCNNCAWKEAERQGLIKNSTTNTSSKNGSSSGKNGKKSDPYNVYEYKSASAFADDKYEEFYDYEDDFDDEEDAWDEAYDYWLKKHRK